MATPFDDLMTQTARLLTFSTSESDFGASGSPTYTDSGTDIAGMLQPITATASSSNSTLHHEITHEWFYDGTNTIKPMDRLRISSVDYDVVGPPKDYTAQGFEVKIVLLKVRKSA